MRKPKKAVIPNLASMSRSNVEVDSKGIISQLLKDHKKMKALMAKIKSSRTSEKLCEKTFKVLLMIVQAHTKSEEKSLLSVIENHPRFEDMAKEGIQEHLLHEAVTKEINRTRDLEKKCVRIKIFCEMLEHHLKEEEKDLFPAFIDYTAKSTRRKMGTIFRKERKKFKDKKEEKMYKETVQSRNV
jgi:hemerythrin superfamily protein